MVQFFLFSAGALRFALPLASVQSVIQMMEITPPDGMRPGAAGTINLHGSITPVFAPGELAGHSPRLPRLTDMLLVAQAGPETVALWIDETRGVGEVDLTPAGSESHQDSGVITTKSGIHAITDLPRFLAAMQEGQAQVALRALQVAGESSPSCGIIDEEREAGFVRAILAGRAAKMVRPEPDSSPAEISEVLHFQLAYQQYAVEMKYIREVILTGEITPVPGTPDFISGICAVRGQIISLVDLRALFRIPEKGLTDLNRVIVMTNGTITFGILADSISGAGTLALDRLSPPDPGDIPGGQRYLKGIAPGGVYLLDAREILDDPGIIVDDA